MITQIVDDFAKDPIEEHESNLNKSNHEVRVVHQIGACFEEHLHVSPHLSLGCFGRSAISRHEAVHHIN
jgi:hypothetical protein